MRALVATLIVVSCGALGCENKKEDVAMTNQAESVEAADDYVEESFGAKKSFQHARDSAKVIEGKAQDRADRAGDALKDARAE